MAWRPGNNTTEDAGHPKPWLSFLGASKETPDDSKAVVKSHRGAQGDMEGPKPSNASADDGDTYIGSRTHTESSPRGRHSSPPPPPQARDNPRIISEKDRRWSQERRPSNSPSRLFVRQRQRLNRQYQESRDTSAASVSIDPSKAEDVTLHLSLPTAYDIEDALEEAARLRRIGHFKDAIDLYEQDLGQFLDIRYVMIQYAECLLEAGRISKFSELCMKLPDRRLMDSLDLNWAFMKLRPDALASFPLQLQDVLDDASKIIHRSWPRLDSTEAQLLIYGLDRFDNDTDWHFLYRHLRDEYMIWEFHDLFVSMASKFGLKVTWRRFFPSARDIPTNCLEQLDQDWAKEGTDISANFALLDILTTSGLSYLRVRDTKVEALKCLKKASEHATFLRSQDARNIKSRPYLRWMVAKTMIEECPYRAWTLVEDELGIPNPLVRGFLTPTGVFPDQYWPLYAPFGNEQIRFVGTNNAAINKRLVTIVNAAEEMGDFLLRTACLKELVLNGAEETEGIMEKLEALWEESGHADSVYQMHLYKYLLIKEPSDNDKVRRRILLDGETSTGWVYYTRCRVMAALATSERERDHYQQEAEDYYNQNRAARDRRRGLSVSLENSTSQERSHPHLRGHDSQKPHISGDGREREKSSDFHRPSDGQRVNVVKLNQPKLPTPRPSNTHASTVSLTPKPKAHFLKEQEQNEIIRSREDDVVEQRENDAIGAATASGGKMTDFAVTKYSGKNLVTTEFSDDDLSDEPETETEEEEAEDLPRGDSTDALSDEKAELESTHGEEDEG